MFYQIHDECQIERSKTVARWIGIGLVSAVLRSVWNRAEYPLEYYWGLVAGAAFFNLLHTLYLFQARSCPTFYKYLTVSLDLLFLTAAMVMTGGSRSPLFYVYFVILISNCIRYGLLMSLFIAGAVNVLYVIVLTIDRSVEPSVLGGEGLKILAFWGVALYGGTVAARLRRQAHEIATHEDTIAELRAELKRHESIADA